MSFDRNLEKTLNVETGKAKAQRAQLQRELQELKDLIKEGKDELYDIEKEKEDVVKATKELKKEDVAKATKELKKEELAKATKESKKEELAKAVKESKKEELAKATKESKKEDVAKATKESKKEDVAKVTKESKKEDVAKATKESKKMVNKNGTALQNSISEEEEEEEEEDIRIEDLEDSKDENLDHFVSLQLVFLVRQSLVDVYGLFSLFASLLLMFLIWYVE